MRFILLFILIFLFFFLQYRLWFGYGNYPDSWRLEKAIVEQEAKVNALRQENAQLMNEIKAQRNDPNAIEAAARRRLGMIKKGETFYQVIEQRDDTAPEND